jgi:uncharacterized protein YdaU (DUF1376 family)
MARKQPAFQFYAADFYMDTLTWDADEIGVYICLLMAEWVNGPLENDTRKLAKIAKKTHQKFIKNWSKINHKFVENGDGKLKNLRLEATREKQLEYQEKQIESGRMGGLKTQEKKKQTSSEPSSDAKANLQATLKPKSSSSSSSSISNINNKDINITLSELLRDRICERNKKFKMPLITSWANHIDLMIRVDSRSPDDIEKVIEWCQGDPFWRNNILSTEKLRKQYDQLFMKMEEMKDGNRPRTSGSKQQTFTKAGTAQSDGADYPIDGEYG